MRLQLGLALGITLALSACASDPSEQPMPEILFDATKQLLAKKPDLQSQRQVIQEITREQFIGIGTDPLILVDIEANQQYATLSQIADNGAYHTYVSGDGKTMTFTSGILTSTKGLGADLMSLEASNTIDGLRQESTSPISTIRTHGMLNQLNEIVTVSYKCQLRFLGRKKVTSVNKDFVWSHFEEACVAKAPNSTEYTNAYWLDPKTDVMWKSRQWIGIVAGYVVVETLIPSKNK